MATITDKFTETQNGQNPTSTTVSSPRVIGGTTLVCTSLAGWPTNTAVHFATYQKDSTGAKIAGSQVDWKGIVSGSSVNTLTRQGGAVDGGNSVGDIVEMMPTFSWAQDLAKGLENQHNEDGTHAAITATTGAFSNALSANGGLTVLNSFIATGLVSYADLLSTIFSGQVQNQANAGTAGGTMYYINLGGLKLLWITTGTLGSNNVNDTSADYTITLPTSFFTTIQSVLPTVSGAVGDIRQGAQVRSISTTSITVHSWSPNGGSTNINASVLVIGT